MLEAEAREQVVKCSRKRHCDDMSVGVRAISSMQVAVWVTLALSAACSSLAPVPNRNGDGPPEADGSAATDGGATDGGATDASASSADAETSPVDTTSSRTSDGSALQQGESDADADADEAADGADAGEPVGGCPDAHGEMVLVPAGEFLFGPNDTKTTLPAFCIDKYEVRADAYATCVKAGGCIGHSKWPQCKDGDSSAPNSCLSKPGDSPANWIDWYRAFEYCEWAQKALPTEEQWEKAARGTDGRLFPWGNSIGCKHAHWGRSVGFDTCKGFGGLPDKSVDVTLYQKWASPYGALQMAGNVREWIDYRKDKTKPPPASGFAVSKGGEYRESKAGVSSVGSYKLLGPDVAMDSQGFRCAVAFGSK